MQLIERMIDGGAILHDEALGSLDPGFFDPGRWRRQGALSGTPARGRGFAIFFMHGQQEYVLRHYRRGGMVARLSRDQYLYTGLQRTRPWRELLLTAHLFDLGLPVPRPVAAHVQRRGCRYRADIVTERIPEARPLSEWLHEHALDEAQWCAIGACIRRFHECGVDHADLNAHNILLDSEGRVFVIDFDRGRLRKHGGWRTRNLSRLARSFRKLAGLSPRFNFTGQAWSWLLEGYHAGEPR